MKKNEYRILIVFLMMMSVLIGYLGWVTMQKRTIAVVKKTIYQGNRVESKQDYLDTIVHEENIPVDTYVKNEHIVENASTNKETTDSVAEVEDVEMIGQLRSKEEIASIEDIEESQMDDTLPSDEILARDEEPPVDLETVEDLEVLGYSSDEAKRIVEEKKRVRKHPNMPMPLPINPKIIEDMRTLGYSKEEAQKIINENMNNPEALEHILVNIDRN